MRWSGFPGKRVDPQRAGRTPRMKLVEETEDTLGKGWASVSHGSAAGQERFMEKRFAVRRRRQVRG